MKVKISDIFDFEKGTLQSSKCTVGEYDFITASSDWKKHNTYSHECEALIIAVAASGSLGRTHYVSGKFIASDLCFILQPKAKFKEKINLKFYFEYFNFIKNDLIQKTATGSAKKAINKFNFAKYEIIFPDKKYQDKIVQRLSEFKNNFSRIEENLNYNAKLTTKLRQSILQDAIQGKLVPQDPTDEPASELLKKIKEKKEQLIKEGKIKKEKNIQLPVNKNSEIPNGWIICALGEIGNAIDSPIVDGPFGSSINTNTDYISNGVPVIRMMNIKPLNYIGNNLKFVSENKFNGLKRHNVIPNDILFSKVGAGIGECCIYPATEKEGMLSTTGVIRFRVGEMVISKYLCYFLLAKKDYFLEIASQTAQPFLNMSMIKNTEFLLPPKEEQKRIVARLDELMQLCDKLENENNNAQKYSSELLQSIMQKYFSPEV